VLPPSSPTPLLAAFASSVPATEVVAVPSGLLLPALLIGLGAVLGGLRALLGSPIRTSLLAGLPESWLARADRALRRQPTLPAAAGLLRLFCIAGAAALTMQASADFGLQSRILLWIAAALLAGFVLEGIPSLIQRRRARRIALAFLPLVMPVAWLIRPLTWLFERGLTAVAGADATSVNGELSTQLLDVAAGHEPGVELGEAERRMIARVLDLPGSDAAGAMTPRTHLTAIPVTASLAEALAMAEQAGHSRIPVLEKDLDDVVGIFHVKDVLSAVGAGADLAATPVRAHLREPYFVPETMPVMALLEEMRQRRNHLAVVVDEYGGTAGVVTIEDLVEEIVGPIRDEHDQGESEARMQRVTDDELLADGRVSLYDLNEFFGCELPEDEDYDTVAGLLFDRIGHIPRRGETLAADGVTIEVLEADDRRVQRVRILRNAPTHAGAESA
jgi:putative hemolysin